MMASKVRLYSELLNSIDFATWNALKERWTHNPSDAGFIKYFDYEFELNQSFELLEAIGWPDRSIKCLDISTGFGWMPFILKHLSCSVSVTDVNDERNAMCQSVRDFLKLPPTTTFKYEKRAFKPLPIEFQGLDLITALSAGGQESWRKECWHKFMEDALSRLNPKGKLFLRPNRSEYTQFFFHEAIEQKNVKIDKQKNWSLIWKD